MTPPGTLYVVATPIGNLEDITLRALRILRECAVIATEDTRTARKLLERHGIATPCVSCHEHSGGKRLEEILGHLRGGRSVAVVSEAGTPGISDPGEPLVRAAAAAGIPVVPVPGAVAFVTALSASGLPTERIAFEGFLPSRAAERRARLDLLVREGRTLAFYESPHRLAGMLADLAAALGPDRPACVARELTKIHEEFDRGTLGELAARWGTRDPRGEFTVLVAGAVESADPAPEADLLDALRRSLARGLSPSESAREVARALGARRARAYELALTLARQPRD